MSISAEKRHSLPASEFGLPDREGYPVDTRGRAASAKSRAAHEVKTGTITSEEKAQIDRRADQKLYGSSREPNKYPRYKSGGK